MVQLVWLEEDDTPAYAKSLAQRIGKSGTVKEATILSAVVLIDGDNMLTLWTNEELELVHRPAPKEQLPLIEVES